MDVYPGKLGWAEACFANFVFHFYFYSVFFKVKDASKTTENVCFGDLFTDVGRVGYVGMYTRGNSGGPKHASQSLISFLRSYCFLKTKEAAKSTEKRVFRRALEWAFHM